MRARRRGTPFAAAGILALVARILAAGSAARAEELVSPGGAVAVTCEVRDFDGARDCLVYRVASRGKPIVADSKLGLDLEGAPLGEDLVLAGRVERKSDSIWRPIYGERNTVRDRYSEVVLELRERRRPHRAVHVTFRAYDEGAAFRYTIPKQEGMERVAIAAERSEFRFLADHTAWVVYSAQGVYEETTLARIRAGCERPLTIRAADDAYVAIAEAGLVDYARMKFAPLAGKRNSLVSRLDGPVAADLPVMTPWRVIMAAESPGKLLEGNDIILNLNAPCAIEDPSWIRPGKVIREVTLTTAGGKACVEFAAAHGLQYVEFDAGWYGHEYDDAADARSVNVDPKRSPGPLDLAEVIRHADSRGIGIILYVNRRALERQLDEILPLYRSWGVKGVKYGFVNVGSQRWTSWLHAAVRKAAQNRLMVDIHDEYRPTGTSRTYPNLMTQEGIAGDETSPSNRLTLTILFTRMLAGAADNTICYYDPRVEKNASHAYQLAKAVCLYSPWQFLYWYDRPPASPRRAGGAGGNAGVIGDEPELEFFAAVPTVWDDTRVIHGRIGEYAAIARRSGESWFVGCMNAGEARVLEIPLSFLDPDRPYVAHIYGDDPSIGTRTHVKIERSPVGAKTTLRAAMTAAGGFAARILPAMGGQAR